MTVFTFDFLFRFSMMASCAILLKCLSMILTGGMAIRTFEPIACYVGFMRKFDIVECDGAFLHPHMAESCASHLGFKLPRLVPFIDYRQGLFGLIVGRIEEFKGIFDIVDALAQQDKTVIVACLIEEVLSFFELPRPSPALFKII
jgi:glycosyltransferase involved in cell wall biosynthesis